MKDCLPIPTREQFESFYPGPREDIAKHHMYEITCEIFRLTNETYRKHPELTPQACFDVVMKVVFGDRWDPKTHKCRKTRDPRTRARQYSGRPESHTNEP